jgi:F-type H+-transporting ATPase subunit 8
MPQLIPFYFVNQVSFAYLSLIILIWVLSKWILPNITLIRFARISILNPHA